MRFIVIFVITVCVLFLLNYDWQKKIIFTILDRVVSGHPVFSGH